MKGTELNLNLNLNSNLNQNLSPKEHTKEAWCKMHGHIQGLEHGGIMNCGYGMGVGWGDKSYTPVRVQHKYFHQKRKDMYCGCANVACKLKKGWVHEALSHHSFKICIHMYPSFYQ